MREWVKIGIGLGGLALWGVGFVGAFIVLWPWSAIAAVGAIALYVADEL